MSHAFPRLGAETCCDQLVVAPHRAIEEDQGGAGKPRLEIVSYVRAGGEKVKILARSLVTDPKPKRVARAVASRRVNLSFQIPCAFAGNLEWQDFNAGR